MFCVLYTCMFWVLDIKYTTVVLKFKLGGELREEDATQVLYLRSFALFRNSTFSPLSPHFFDLKISRYFETPCLKVTKKKVLKNIYF